MATLLELYNLPAAADFPERVTAASWDHCKEVILNEHVTQRDKQAASRILDGLPRSRIITGVAIVLQDVAAPTDAQIKSATDQVMDRLDGLGG